MSIKLLPLIVFFGFAHIASSENAPIKFGELSKAELLNNVYAADTSASAVVLCDYGYYSFSKRQTVRIFRIKILKKEGYAWANQVFDTDSRTSIRGITYNFENNEIIETKLKPESIFKTRITENYYEVRVAMPNVKVGSVIDIQFEFEGIPQVWDFQQDIPVIRSELVIEPGMYMMYHKNFFGNVSLTVNTGDHWVSENVPAFKAEPFMTSSKNYRSRFEFDVEYIIYPEGTKEYTTTWDAVRDLLYESDYFGSALKKDDYLKIAAKDIKSKCASQEEMIKSAFAYAKKIKWDYTNSFFTDNESISTCLKAGKGNSAEVNLALVQLLRLLDFDAVPVVLSTRSNGRLSTLHPSINKLNYVIAAVFTAKDTLLMDATEAHSPYNLLPMRTLNGKGQVMDKKRTGWIELDSGKKEKKMLIYTLSIEDNLSLKGKLSYSAGDYAALNFRNDYDDFNSDEAYVTDYINGKKGLKIVTHKIENLDSLDKPISEEFEIVINNMVSDIDGELYIIPILYEQIRENPFKINDRKYPVDFGYLRDKTVIANYTIPKGYKVANLPANRFLRLPGNTAIFQCQSTVTEGTISIMYKLSLNKSEFVQKEYADFREFYNQVVAKEAEPIVLKKN